MDLNNEFIQFLSDQGSEYLIAFAMLSQDQQEQAQADWLTSREGGG